MTAHSPVKSRASPFGYVCRRCSRCCRDKQIQLNPYEVAHLARARGESTTQFRVAWTADGTGTILRQKADGTCVFLGPQGCEVHANRPLVCRLYPLGREVLSDGSEHYIQLEGHPLSEGEFHERGTIDDFLEGQGAKPFIAAADGYFRWLSWARKQLDLAAAQANEKGQQAADDMDLLDMDRMIVRHCATTGEPEPENMEDRLRLHLKLLYDAVSELETSRSEKG